MEDFFTSITTPASRKVSIHNDFTHFVIIPHKHKCGGFLQVSQHHPTGKSLSIMTLHIHFCYNPTETQVWRISTSTTTSAYRKVSTIWTTLTTSLSLEVGRHTHLQIFAGLCHNTRHRDPCLGSHSFWWICISLYRALNKCIMCVRSV